MPGDESGTGLLPWVAESGSDLPVVLPARWERLTLPGRQNRAPLGGRHRSAPLVRDVICTWPAYHPNRDLMFTLPERTAIAVP